MGRQKGKRRRGRGDGAKKTASQLWHSKVKYDDAGGGCPSTRDVIDRDDVRHHRPKCRPPTGRITASLSRIGEMHRIAGEWWLHRFSLAMEPISNRLRWL